MRVKLRYDLYLYRTIANKAEIIKGLGESQTVCSTRQDVESNTDCLIGITNYGTYLIPYRIA